MSTPSDPSRLPASWKSAHKAPARRQLATPRWKREADRLSRPAPRWSRPAKAALLAAAGATLGGLFLWLVFWLRPLPRGELALFGAGYQENLAMPHNAYGVNGLLALSDLVSGAGAGRAKAAPAGLRSAQTGPITLTNDSLLFDELKQSSARTTVLFLALHGAADERGAFLFLDSERPGSAPARLYLADLLARLKQLSPRRFVLVLDATQLTAAPQLGVLHNDFAAKLQGLDRQIEDAPNLVVLSSSGADQASWVSDRWRTTVFAHYLNEALAGGRGEFTARRIDVDAIFQYVRKKVARWVLDNRGTAQTPVLYPENGRRARSFEVALAGQASPVGRDEGPRTGPIPVVRREAWESAWKDYHELNSAGPSPAVNTPLLWRRYRDWLVRYDQLVRADDARAAAVRVTLDAVRSKIKAGARVALDSSANTLAMSAAEGLAASDPTREQAEFNELWADPAATKDMKLGEKPETRWAFTRLLYRRVEADPSPANLATAAKLIPDLATPGKPRPAEVHFLAMLAANAPAKPADPASYQSLAARALKVRSHAERAALGVVEGSPAFSEHVAPWTSAAIRRADESRRRGEDLAFADDPASWAEAGKRFDEAERLYRQADVDAARAREALTTCDRALADLPCFAEWAAQLSTDDKAADAVRTLLGHAYRIAARLTPEAGGRSAGLDPAEATRAQLDQVDQDAKDLADGLADLRARFAASVDGADAGYAASASALLTPFPDTVDARESLLKRLYELSPETKPGGRLGESALASAQDSAGVSARLAARRRESLSLALLGEDWAEDSATVPDPDDPSDASAAGDLPAPTTQEPEPAGSSEGSRPTFDRSEKGLLLRAGARTAARWRAMPRAVRQWARVADKPEPGAAQPDLPKADRVARRLPGGVAMSPEPAELYRNTRLQELLVTQAGRTLADHWFGTDDQPATRPYYAVAGLGYLKDARSLDPRKQDPAAAAALRKGLERVDRLDVVGPAPLAVTSETRAVVEYRLSIPMGSLVPEGHPVVWLARESPGLFRTEPARDVRASREVKALSANAGPAESAPAARFRADLDLELTRQVDAKPEDFRRPEQRKTAVVLDGFYRGQLLHAETPVTFHPVPEIATVRYPLPTRGKVAVSAEPGLIARFGEGGGSMAIVLDCSGSMGGATSRAADGSASSTKYQEATAALRQLLGQVSRGTTVSLWVFGEELAGNKDDQDPERTIKRVLDPTPWNPDDPNQLEQVMRRVEPPALNPYNQSPIVRSMIFARDDLRDAQGYKTLLVLTDGMDNRFEKDGELNAAKKDVPTALRDAFGGSDVEINVVGYKLGKSEEVEARKQFKVIEDLPRPGRFFSVKDARQLASTLGRALRPTMRCTLDTIGNESADGLTVSHEGDNDRWSSGLLPRGYKLVVRAGQRLERELVVNRGDLLLVRLGLAGRGGVSVDRGLFSGDPRPRNSEEKETGWRASVVRNGRSGKAHDGLELWTTLEKLPTPRETALEVVKPREVWSEVEPAGAPTGAAFAQRWAYQVGLPAPCWGVRVPAWPGQGGASNPARPTVKTWWDPDQEASLTSEVVRLADFRSTEEIPAREVKVGDRSVFIESVGVEPRRVEAAPGEFREESCLVVRLRHEEGQPFWVRTEGMRTEGAEHRFYSRANRYTGVFWPVTRDQADVALRGLGLVSLAEFKARAERRGYKSVRPAPGAPDARDTGPTLVPFDEPGPEPLAAGAGPPVR